jgi:hypothetical protein
LRLRSDARQATRRADRSKHSPSESLRALAWLFLWQPFRTLTALAGRPRLAPNELNEMPHVFHGLTHCAPIRPS